MYKIALLISMLFGCLSSYPVEIPDKNVGSISDVSTKLNNVVFCDFSHNKSMISPLLHFLPNKPCRSDYYSFSFSALFHNKNLLKTSSLKFIAQSISENTFCDIRYMKYDNSSQSLSYFQSGDDYYWTEGKQLNSTKQPEVYILKDGAQNERKKIVIKCPLPPSDVSLSLNHGDLRTYRPAQSHPQVNNRVTVSAFHVKLSFTESQGLNLNEFQSVSRNMIQKTLFKNNKQPERFLVYYDSRCRNCDINSQLSSFDPFKTGSIMCSLKGKTCEYEGACYQDREIYTPLDYLDHESEKPTLNMFVCNTDYSQTSLYMPCAINNGNCAPENECMFNSTTYQVKCL